MISITNGSESARQRTYEVRSGDTLAGIAERVLGQRDRWKEIWALNPELKDPTQLRPGDVLKLPFLQDKIDYDVIFTQASEAVYAVPSHAVEHLEELSRTIASPAAATAAVVPPDITGEAALPSQNPTPAPWASWNSLTQSHDDGAVVETPLEIGQQYDLRFDLTLGTVGTTHNSPVDLNAKETLKRLKGKHPKLFAVPVISGRELKLLTGAPPLAFPLDPQRLEAVEVRKDGESDLDYVRRVAAATITIPVHAVNSGCAFLGLSLWTATEDNLKPNRPFDFILRRVQVGDGPMRCDETGLLQSGLQASFINRAGIAVDASLHIFQLPTGRPVGQPQRYSQAVYVDSSGKPLTWQLAEDLASYVAQPTVYLSRQLHWALQRHNYRPLRAELTRIIFPSGDDAATRALASIKALAVLAEQRPVTVYASLVGDDGWPQVFPIGLVNGDGDVALGSRITFIEPLQRENATAGRCVSQWTFFLPPRLLADNGFSCPVEDAALQREPASDNADAANAKPAAEEDVSTILWNRLMQYLGVDAQAQSSPAADGADGSHPEGLLLLAHQGIGVLSFSSDGEPGIKSSQVSHKYTAGSMGVLVACEGSSSGVATANLDWLTKFNELNMDVILVSPFSLPIEIGGCFARRWRMALEKARTSPEALTIADIHRSVLKQMKADLIEDVDKEVMNAAYQFVLTGNAHLPVCGSAK